MRNPSKRGLLKIKDGFVNYLFLPAAKPIPGFSPIVLLGGTAQTLNSLLMHHAPLSQHRDILHYECRGQGRTTNLSLEDCSLQRHCQDFEGFVDAVGEEGLIEKNQALDIVGFSFGARLGIAIAANSPNLVRKLVATGAPADRRAIGRIVLRTWQRTLERGHLEDFMWQSMSAGHSASFLSKHEDKLEEWVNSAAAQNRAEAILSLVRDTHTDDVRSPWHTTNLAQAASSNGLGVDDSLFIAGSEDLLAPPQECEALAAVGGWRCVTIHGAGHAVPIEAPEKWRHTVLSFLDGN